MWACACYGVVHWGLTPPALSKLAEKSPNAIPATPPIAPDSADFTKQLSMMSWNISCSKLGGVSCWYVFRGFIWLGSW